MATITPVIDAVGTRLLHVSWGPMEDGDIGEWAAIANLSDKTVHIEGTITAFALEGTNAPDGTLVRTVTDVASVPVTAVGLYAVRESPLLIRPNLTTGAGVTVRIIAR